MTAPTVKYGKEDVALNNTILRCVVGSELYGIASSDSSDRDEMGIYIEPPEYVIGLNPPLDHFISRSVPEGVRSGPGDLDLTMYSLRRYIELAIKGNPTALLPLFAPESAILVNTGLGRELRELRQSFLSLEAVERFLGYMHAQHERMMGGGKKNRVPNRPELVEKYGYDTKYAAHSLRLAMQGQEIVSMGTLSLPMEAGNIALIKNIRNGGLTKDQVSNLVASYEEFTRDGMAKSPLPLKADYDKISLWMQEAHLRHWEH